MGLPFDLRDLFEKKRKEEAMRRIQSAERASSLAAPRRAAWEHGNLTLGFALKTQKLARHEEVPKAR